MSDKDSGGGHEGTPTITHLHGLGRVYPIEVARDGIAHHNTSLVLEIPGEVLYRHGPSGRRRSGAGNPSAGPPHLHRPRGRALYSTQGATLTLLDAQHQPAKTWRSGGLTLRRSYDALRRPLGLYVDEGSGERLVEYTVYGDAVSDTPDFSHGRPVQVYDTAGRVAMTYDFKGRVLSQSRELIDDITTEADWSGLASETSLADIETWVGSNAGLEAETYTISTEYDAPRPRDRADHPRRLHPCPWRSRPQTDRPTASSQHDKGPEPGPPGALPRHPMTHPVQAPSPTPLNKPPRSHTPPPPHPPR